MFFFKYGVTVGEVSIKLPWLGVVSSCFVNLFLEGCHFFHGQRRGNKVVLTQKKRTSLTKVFNPLLLLYIFICLCAISIMM